MPSENTDEAILFHCHCDDATLIIKRYLSTNSEMKNTHTETSAGIDFIWLLFFALPVYRRIIRKTAKLWLTTIDALALAI